MGAPIQIRISLVQHGRPGCDPDVEVTPAQVHVKGGADVHWQLAGGSGLTIAFKKGALEGRGDAPGSVVLHIPDNAPPDTYSYSVVGKIPGQKDIQILGCPEIIIQ